MPFILYADVNVCTAYECTAYECTAYECTAYECTAYECTAYELVITTSCSWYTRVQCTVKYVSESCHT